MDRKNRKEPKFYADSLLQGASTRPAMKPLMSQQSFFQLVAPALAELEQVVFEELQHYDPELVQAASHLMRAGGKRLRPVMVLLSAMACGAPEAQVSHAHHLLAMAVEVLHTATLIHDDIIDGSSTRRGLPTVNHQWGLRTSVLTGDFLLARSCFYISNIEEVRLNTIFSQMVMDMCNGEIAQLQRRYKSSISLEEYLDQVRSKTALLMAVACQGAAIIQHQPAKIESALYQYGDYVGVAFQIMDDILDFSSADNVLGKSSRNDLIQGQITLPTYYALQHSPYAEELNRLIAGKFESDQELERALEIVLSSDALSRCEKLAENYIAQALEALEALPDLPARQALADLAKFSIQRSQ